MTPLLFCLWIGAIALAVLGLVWSANQPLNDNLEI